MLPIDGGFTLGEEASDVEAAMSVEFAEGLTEEPALLSTAAPRATGPPVPKRPMLNRENQVPDDGLADGDEAPCQCVLA